MKKFNFKNGFNVFIITKKQIMTAISVILAITVIVTLSAHTFANGERLLPIYCVDTEEKKIAISFDAAWGNDDTGTLIKILDEYDVPATFFVVGAWVDKYPESVMQLHKAGHQIQNHSNTHPYLTSLTNSQIADEIENCNNKIYSLTGVKPTLIRPPYGDYDNAVIKTVSKLNMQTIQWSVDSLDWCNTSTAESIYKKVVRNVQNGSIILCHNDAEHTPEALPKILDTLKKDGYEFVFISDLILKDNYKIDHTGKQHKTEN